MNGRKIASVISMAVLIFLLGGCKEKISNGINSQQKMQKSDCKDKKQVSKMQRSKEILSQKRAEKCYATATDLYKKTTEKYEQELLIINSEKDPDQIKKLLGKIVGNKRYEWSWTELFWAYYFSGNDIPFHEYVKNINSDISALNKMCRKLKSFKQSAHIQDIVKQMTDLIDRLKEIISYVEKHKEFRNESRFLLSC